MEEMKKEKRREKRRRERRRSKKKKIFFFLLFCIEINKQPLLQVNNKGDKTQHSGGLEGFFIHSLIIPLRFNIDTIGII